MIVSTFYNCFVKQMIRFAQASQALNAANAPQGCSSAARPGNRATKRVTLFRL
jgi:hypothetical protein